MTMQYQVIKSEEIAYRHDFPLLCNARGYEDAVEVGVDLGVFARLFLDRFQGSWLLLIDPYLPYAEIPHDRSLDAATALQALSPHHGRFRFIRDRSPEVIASVLTFIQKPEFVYIDGSHDEFDVYQDIKAWWDIVPNHGMVAGHDYDEQHPGVMASVNRFAEERGLVVRLTMGDKIASWYCYRYEPEFLHQRLYVEGTLHNPHYRP